ncbi:hypothetical protein [Prescottella equi]|uniref:hypothetical protein n=1 Tax=Rhodococcus hoagii TaxID=43767 RepID=UPI00384EF4D5
MFKFFRRRPATPVDQTEAPASNGGVPLDAVPAADRARLDRIAADFNSRPPEERSPFVEPDSNDYDLWQAGKLVPWAITHLLDAGGHAGPSVDLACGVQEPAVDLWEAGRLYPSWEQTVALARLLNVRVRILMHPDAQPRHHENRPHRRVPGTAILSFEPDAVAAATRKDVPR